MTPLKLTMRAFGSYLERAEIDFSRFAGCGIFLICGPTGGGKTTILDAITAALYGEVTGSLRNKDKSGFFRCKAADPKTDTEVEFIFSVHGETYKFYRRWRMRKNGLEPVEYACYRLINSEWDDSTGGEWALERSRKISEVSARAVELLGLDRGQFTKVICLPQGEFRELLTSDSAERTKVFEKLFGTERWKMIKERLAAGFESARQEVSLIESGEGVMLAAASCRSAAELDEKIGEVKASADELGAAHKKAALEAERHAALTAAALAFAEAARESDRADAAKVRAEAALGEISGKIKSLENELGADADADAADNQISGLQLTVARLESAHKKLGEIAGLQSRSNALEVSIREAERNIADIGGRIAASEDRAENGRKVVAECERSAQGFGEIEARRGELREVCAKFAELSRLEDELAAAELRLPPLEKAQAAAREELDKAASRLESLHTAHRRDAAYALSRGLSEGEPCPVCGSAAHPNPASPASGAPGEEEIRGAEKSADLLRKKLENALAEKNTVSA
ncbi:MAG: SMC family ATPase, partial [Oscillospiraceae bacterium]|nr:SMC family ATPase [Oscillospiraceae bacterium]